MEIILFIVGGLAGLYQAVSGLAGGTNDSVIVKTGLIAFIMGAVLWGGILNLIYLAF